MMWINLHVSINAICKMVKLLFKSNVIASCQCNNYYIDGKFSIMITVGKCCYCGQKFDAGNLVDHCSRGQRQVTHIKLT